MSSSRLLFLGSSPFRTHKPLPFQHLFTTKPSPLSSLRFSRHCSSAAVDTVTAAVDTDAENSSSPLQHHHPWPEWVSFVDRLKTKGYFDGDNITNDATVSNSENFSVDYKDMNVVKDACLSFARDRYDIFKSLPVKDMQTLVGNGCPNLLRKAVNSAKRLRAHLRMDEGDVCSACNLRGSCDRAYVTLKENEAAARTVDIVRILLFYALDPLVVAGGEKHPGGKNVDASVRKMFLELIKLSETAPDPSLPKAALRSPKKEKTVNRLDDEPSRDVEMKRGDWICPKCNFMNFSRNTQCRQCKEDGPKNVGVVDVEMKKGDWTCSKCNFMNFSRNKRCLKCKADGPNRVDVNEVEKKKGDWDCPQCGFLNFSSNKKCLRCPESRPKRQLNPGEWECPLCDFLNYRRNRDCLKCNGERPKRAATEYEDHTWSRPRVSDTFTGTH
ncbi:hypothetical protein Q3G72_015872 [Acer saccharum]|nr:hypothetical protein Q3G72_015872 [Acer saccharum]